MEPNLDTLMITTRHLRMARLEGKQSYCMPAARLWLARHGMDMGVFAREGYPASLMLQHDVPLIQPLVDAAIAEYKENNRG